MELDERIKSKNDILTCFDVKDAGQFLAQEGYFSDFIDNYRWLDNRKYGILTEIKDSDCPFKEGNNEFWRFFIPESRLLKTKQKESKYVPFETTHDLAKVNFHTSDIINFMNKKFPGIIHRAIITEVNYDEVEERLIDITLGSTTYSFNTLCDEYMYLNAHLKWVPFGKRVEE